MNNSATHICVCICTYKRPRFLDRLLNSLHNQMTYGIFTYSINVVDNDCDMSGKKIVKAIQKKTPIQIRYFLEPEKNISLARNKAVQNSIGDFIAFIDDDEFPVNDWLFILLNTSRKYCADGVLGPVIPHFEKEPPNWIIKSRVCERPKHETGTILNWNNTRTGNVLIKREIFDQKENLFDPNYGTGHEDQVLFMKLISKGYIFVWSNEAIVYETMPSNRLKLSYFLKRALLEGQNSLKTIKKMKSKKQKNFIYLKTISAFLIYTIVLPILLLGGRHTFNKYLIKNFHHIGRLFAMFGMPLLKNRNF